MSRCSLILSLILIFVQFCIGKDHKVFIKRSKYVRKVPPEFVSISLDTGIARYRWCGLNFTFVEPLARQLSPAYLRFGGTNADALIFQPGDQNPGEPCVMDECKYRQTIELIKSFNFSSYQLDQIYNFAKNSGLRFIFDLNMARRQGLHWDPTNALQFIDYAHRKGYDLDFELGNEPDHWPTFYHISVNGSQVAKDYSYLRKLLNGYKEFKSSKLIGPSIGSYTQILKEFVEAKGSDYVNGLSFHFYYMAGETAKLEDFLNATIFDYLLVSINRMTNYTKGSVWLGEGSSAYDGGAPNISDTYASGFMYLDMLGLSALHGVDVVVRQDFYHGNYSLLNDSMRPNHDYWIAVLHKKLVGQKILNITVNPPDRSLRLYAACNVRKDPKYSFKKQHRVVLYGIKLTNESFTLDFPQLSDTKATLYLLRPAEPENLQSKRTTLNGRILDWDPAKEFPKFRGLSTRLPVKLPGYSQFFLELYYLFDPCKLE